MTGQEKICKLRELWVPVMEAERSGVLFYFQRQAITDVLNKALEDAYMQLGKETYTEEPGKFVGKFCGEWK